MNISAGNITPEVADVADKMFNAIRECSKGMAVADAAYSAFYGNTVSTLSALLKALSKTAVKSTTNWIKATKTNYRYRNCIAATALQWRSPLQMALMGI